jgi:hypothetical protein
MKRSGIVLLVVLAVIATASPVVAQPKVTITGLVDHVTSWQRNQSQLDANLARTADSEWYARTRIVPFITAAVGTTEFVLGLEMDSSWGQTGATDVTGPNHFGTTSSFDLNTDLQGVIELKWAYTEFNVPLIPMATRARIGAQGWEALYKPGIFATGDFAGAHLTTQWAPGAKSYFTFVQIEESSTGPTDAFIRGDDVGIIASVEVTPFKGLDIRPIFSYANFIGVTNTARTGRGGLGAGAGVYQTCPSAAGAGTGVCLAGSKSSVEDRFTVGVDTRWRFGAFSLDPTFFYQFGSRDQVAPTNSFTSGPAVHSTLTRDAWLVDLRGGWRAGPLLLEGIFVYTTGNEAKDRIDLNRSELNYFEPISTDNGFFGTWSEIQAGNIDYFNRVRGQVGGGSLNPAVTIGYDKYGMIAVGTRANYALTPAFTLRAMAHARWTAEEVDTASTIVAAAANGLTPRCGAAALDQGRCVDSGTASFLGTELNLGFQWRFATNVAFDLVGSYLFTGNAQSLHTVTGTAGAAVNGRNPQDVQAVASRVRFTF